METEARAAKQTGFLERTISRLRRRSQPVAQEHKAQTHNEFNLSRTEINIIEEAEIPMRDGKAQVLAMTIENGGWHSTTLRAYLQGKPFQEMPIVGKAISTDGNVGKLSWIGDKYRIGESSDYDPHTDDPETPLDLEVLKGRVTMELVTITSIHPA